MILYLSILIAVLLALKTFEMVYHCYRVIFGASGDIKQLFSDWPISRVMSRIRLGLLFRLPVLLPTAAFLLASSGLPTWFSVSSASLVVLAIWVELSQTLLSRFTYGFRDIYFRRLSASIGMRRNNGRNEQHHLVRDFVLFVGGFILLAIVGYAGAYTALHRLDTHAFAGSISGFLDCLYFSAATFATVGFGDISPSSPVARLLTISEIFVSIGAPDLACPCLFLNF